MNFARISGVSSPMKAASSPVSPATGATQLTRILSGASSTAIERDIRFTAPLVALYQASPGRGRDVALDRPRVGSDRGCNLVGARTVEIQDRDLGALACEGPRNPGPETRGAAGHQRDFARKAHGTLLPDAELRAGSLIPMRRCRKLCRRFAQTALFTSPEGRSVRPGLAPGRAGWGETE